MHILHTYLAQCHPCVRYTNGEFSLQPVSTHATLFDSKQVFSQVREIPAGALDNGYVTGVCCWPVESEVRNTYLFSYLRANPLYRKKGQGL